MAKRSQRSHKPGKAASNVQDLVVVVGVSDIEEAREYEVLLKNDGIPAVIRQNHDDADVVSVLVPEEYLDEAHVVIESQHAYDDFYEMTTEDQSYEGFDDDFYDDQP